MKKYNVCIKEISFGVVNVEAESEEKAREIAMDQAGMGMAIMAGDVEYETGSVTSY